MPIYIEMHGPIDETDHVHHTCTNPGCINPAHLEALTPAEHGAAHREINARRRIA